MPPAAPGSVLSLRKWLIVVSRSFFLCVYSAFQAFLKHTQRQFPLHSLSFLQCRIPTRGWGLSEKSHGCSLYLQWGGVWAFDGKCYVDSLLNGLRDLLHCLQLADCLAAYT